MGLNAFRTDYDSDLKWVRIENKDMIIPEDSGSFKSYLTIYGRTDSTAQLYAAREHIHFIDYEKQVTDGTFDGMIENDGIEDFITITGCKETVEELIIPSEINGIPVRCIGATAFYEQNELKKVFIPDSVRRILSASFLNCRQLTEVRFSDDLEEIMESAFSSCKALEEIKLPESLTKLGRSAFGGCTSLESVTFSNSLTDIDRQTFINTPWLEKQKNSDGLIIVNDILLDGQDFTGEELIVPDGVRRIADNAFAQNKNIKSVVIPDTVNYIGAECFSFCSALESVTLPDSLADLGYSTFNGCKSLTDISIPEGVTTIGSCCFRDCTALKSIELPDSIRNIEFQSFAQCGELRDISLPAGLEMIDMYTFSRCSSITSISLPPSIKKICDHAFVGCSALDEVTFPEGKDIDVFRSAFQETPWLEKLTENGGLIIINNMVFDGTTCTGDIIIPDGITAICAKAFYRSEITSVTLPDSVKRIGDGAFSECRNIEEFTIPDGFTEITSHMFSGCTSLKKVYIPDSVTAIKTGAFYFCDSLTEFTVPESVTTVEMAFEYCKNLRRIIFENPDCLIYGDSENFEAIPYSTTVCGYAGSGAYWYAYSNKKKFFEIHHKGDVNGDGKINVSDLVAMQKWLLASDSSSLADWYAPDICDDGVIDVLDLVCMRRLLLQSSGN